MNSDNNTLPTHHVLKGLRQLKRYIPKQGGLPHAGCPQNKQRVAEGHGFSVHGELRLLCCVVALALAHSGCLSQLAKDIHKWTGSTGKVPSYSVGETAY